MEEDHNSKIGEVIDIGSNRSTFCTYHRGHFADDCRITFQIWQIQQRKWWRTLYYIKFLTMVSCVRSTGQTLSNTDDFVLEDDFCKFWSVFTCASDLVIILFVGAKGFLTSVTLKSQILNLFVWISAEIGFFSNIRPSFTKSLNCISPVSSIYLIRSNEITYDYWIVVYFMYLCAHEWIYK